MKGYTKDNVNFMNTTENKLTHFDAEGNAVMVDVSGKPVTSREATAHGIITMNEDAFAAVQNGTVKKGDVLGVARVAGIMATKRTSELIPLCHPLPLTKAQIEFELLPERRAVEARCTVKTSGVTGVEMEALTGVSTALLTIYDMCKAVEAAGADGISIFTPQDMTPEQMLRACYDYVRSYKYLGRNAAFGADVKTPPYEKLLEFAQEILSTGKGDCYNFAASFCLLSRRLGFEAACIIGECGYVWNWRPIAHGWVEITKDGQTLLYDPQIENYNIRAGISNDDYGAYGVRYETAHARYLKH